MNERLPSDPDMGGSTESSKLPSAAGRVSASRRQFAKAGVGAPVVLGSLLSKPALGAGYTCTISGQISGNTSSHPTVNTCSELGRAPAYWIGNSWPAGGPTKGVDPGTANCKWSPASGMGTVFNGWTNSKTLDNWFFFNPTVACTTALSNSGLSPNTAPATMLQVLKSTGSAGDVNELGREIVTAILNSLDPSSPSYPVRVPMLIDMFNKVAAGNPYQFPNSTKTWNRTQVLTYLKSLHL